jgi:propanol-preferring alcohol dehydrogenase
MRAVRLEQVGKPLEGADIPIPEIGSSDVLIRIAAAGICHSDAHYRAGISKIDRLPLTLGHEVAGRVEEVGSDVTHLSAGDRVCVHYLVHCGAVSFVCAAWNSSAADRWLANIATAVTRNIKVPGANALLPGIFNSAGAIMMCSSATALHALNKARFKAGESIAILAWRTRIFGIAIVRAFDCGDVYVVEINPAKLASAASGTLATPGPQIRSSKSKRQPLEEESMSHSN